MLMAKKPTATLYYGNGYEPKQSIEWDLQKYKKNIKLTEDLQLQELEEQSIYAEKMEKTSLETIGAAYDADSDVISDGCLAEMELIKFNAEKSFLEYAIKEEFSKISKKGITLVGLCESDELNEQAKGSDKFFSGAFLYFHSKNEIIEILEGIIKRLGKKDAKIEVCDKKIEISQA